MSELIESQSHINKENIIPVSLNDRIASSIQTFAVGDAWGFVTEFLKIDDILRRKPPIPPVLKVSDDTQMGVYSILAVFEMLAQNVDFSTLDESETQNIVRKHFANSYSIFYHDKDNNRSPGITCMASLQKYDHTFPKITGMEGCTNNSLGCGTIMRTPWLGLFPYDRKTLTYLAVLQAQTTHGDARGWIVSAILTLLINDILHDRVDYSQICSLFEPAVKLVDEVVSVELHIGQENFVSAGAEVREELLKFSDNWFNIRDAIRKPAEDNQEPIDVTAIFGEGWVATESLYNGLGVVSAYMGKDEILAGMKRLVYTAGDSDSIAAIGGSLWGVMHGKRLPLTDMGLAFEPRYEKELSMVTNFIQNLHLNGHQ